MSKLTTDWCAGFTKEQRQAFSAILDPIHALEKRGNFWLPAEEDQNTLGLSRIMNLALDLGYNFLNPCYPDKQTGKDVLTSLANAGFPFSKLIHHETGGNLFHLIGSEDAFSFENEFASACAFIDFLVMHNVDPTAKDKENQLPHEVAQKLDSKLHEVYTAGISKKTPSPAQSCSTGLYGGKPPEGHQMSLGI